jgi:hypothetical protein
MPGAHAQRDFTITGACGIPSGAAAASLNFTVWAPVTRGDFRVFPAGSPTPTVATLNWEAGILALGNAAIVPLGAGGAITVQVDGPGTVDLILDVNGYYSGSPANLGNYFALHNEANNYTMYLDNSSTTCTGACGLMGYVKHGTALQGESQAGGDGVFGKSDDASGAGVHGVVSSSITGSTAVLGEHQATGNLGIGVVGTHAGTGWGVAGMSLGTTGAGAAGVVGVSYSSTDGSVGVRGITVGAGKTFGVQGSISPGAAAESAAIHGLGAATAGGSHAVLGENPATSYRSTGVKGIVAGGVQGLPYTTWSPAGVQGEAGGTFGFGVTGFSNYTGVRGSQYDTSGVFQVGGYLGHHNGATSYGVYALGDFGGSGAKYFVEPHPLNAGQVIRFVCLEGPESGTYFRGRGTFAGGVARIEVPESFRMVSDPDGLTVQITPIGRATAWVTRIGLDGIEAEASRDVEFSYLVQGVRKAFRNFSPISEGGEFTPHSPDERMPAYLTGEAKQRLIANGTYHSDGTVNMQTAERLGWAQKWREEEQLRQQAISRAPQETGQAPKQ